jgi:hypothetical protein
MLTHCSVGFLKITDVQSDQCFVNSDVKEYHQHQCIVEKGTEKSGILVLLLVD